MSLAPYRKTTEDSYNKNYEMTRDNWGHIVPQVRTRLVPTPKGKATQFRMDPPQPKLSPARSTLEKKPSLLFTDLPKLDPPETKKKPTKKRVFINKDKTKYRVPSLDEDGNHETDVQSGFKCTRYTGQNKTTILEQLSTTHQQRR